MNFHKTTVVFGASLLLLVGSSCNQQIGNTDPVADTTEQTSQSNSIDFDGTAIDVVATTDEVVVNDASGISIIYEASSISGSDPAVRYISLAFDPALKDNYTLENVTNYYKKGAVDFFLDKQARWYRLDVESITFNSYENQILQGTITGAFQPGKSRRAVDCKYFADGSCYDSINVTGQYTIDFALPVQ